MPMQSLQECKKKELAKSTDDVANFTVVTI